MKSMIIKKRRQINIIYLSLNITSQKLSINLTTYPKFLIFNIILDINTNIIEASYLLIISYIVIFEVIIIDHLTIL